MNSSGKKGVLFMLDRPRQIAIHRGKIKGRVVLQKLHNFFAWGHGCSSNHPRVIRFGCGAAG